MRLLVVDWDYFFEHPDPPDDDWQFYDWSHSEHRAPEFQATMWHHRAFDFLGNGKSLPHTTRQDRTFWDRFRFAKQARCFVSNSNMFSIHAKVRRAVSEVVLFDAHHDAGYKKEFGKYWTCENWGLWYVASLTPMIVNYPRWRTRVFEVEDYCMAEQTADWAFRRQFDPETLVDGTFDKVHICRSDAWVPPWLDGDFQRFVDACPVTRKVELEPLAPRVLDLAQVHIDIQQWEKARELLAAMQAKQRNA